MEEVRKQLLMGDDAPTGRGVRVAVLDTGLDLSHPDFENAVDLTSSASTVSLSSSLDDHCYHGTHVAGIIAGRGSASSGRYRGLAPAAELIVFRISMDGTGFDSDAIKAIELAVAAGADIINYSVGRAANGQTPPWIWAPSSDVEDAFSAACAAGVLCVAAAGNSGPEPGTINRPGGLPVVLTVGALNRIGELRQNSARGPHRTSQQIHAKRPVTYQPDLHRDVVTTHKPDVVAPGCVVAPRARNGVFVRQQDLADPRDPLCPYLQVCGTSQATAVVSGVAACLLQFLRDEGADLGANPGHVLKTLLDNRAISLSTGGKDDFGRGAIKWPNIRAAAVDYVGDDNYRAIVRDGAYPRLHPKGGS